MAKQIDEGMAHPIKGLSFFDWDGLNNDEYDKLSNIINTPNKSSGVELLFEDEVVEVDNAVVDEETIIENVNDTVEECVDVKEEVEVEALQCEEKEVEVPKNEEKEAEAPECAGKEPEEKVVVDIENSVLQPSAPVFQPSIPPPSIMPFPIAVPHWAPHHQHHADPTMPHPAHHHHQPQAGPYSYAVPGGYVFHPHDPSLAAAGHHHGHGGEPTTVQCFVTMSNGHQQHQSVYAYPGHHHIPAHYPYQSNTLAAASGLPSPLPHAAAAAAAHHHQPHHHHHHQSHHHHRHHIPSQTDILHPISGNGIIPNTPSHHHPMGYPQHIAAVTTSMGQGQQPLPAHMVPPHSMSHQATAMPQHHFSQQLHHHLHQSTQFIYTPHEQQPLPSVSAPAPTPSHTTEEGGGDASLCANSSNNNETNSETIPDHSQIEEEEVQPLNSKDNQASVIEDKQAIVTEDNQTIATEDNQTIVTEDSNKTVVTSEEKGSPSKLTLAEIQFGGPVVFDTKPQSVSQSSPVEKTLTKSPAAGKTKTKKLPTPSSSSVQQTKSVSSKKEKASTSSKNKTGPVTDIGGKAPESQQETVVHSINKEESNVIANNSSNVNATKQSSRVNKETTVSNNASSPSASSSQPILSSSKSSVNKKNPPSSPGVNLLPSVNSSVAKEELKSPETNDSSKSNQEVKSDIDSSNKPQLPVSKPSPVSTPTAPKSWSSLFGKQVPNAPSQLPPSIAAPEQLPAANNVESPQPQPSTPVQSSVTSIRHWQEQERHRGKERPTLSSVDNIKAVGVKQDPLAPKLMAKLSNFPISYIPIIVQPRGLTNGRNICFMNATLQVLMGCPPFIHLFRAFRNLPARTGGKSSTPVFDSLVQFVNSFQHCQRTKQQGPVKKGSGFAINQGAPFIPESLLGVAQHILGLNIGVQHDAEEFLSQILSICNEEFERIIKMNNMDSLNNNSAGPVSKNVIGNGSLHHQNGDINNHMDDANDDDGDGSWVQVGTKNYSVETNVNNCGQTPLSAIFAGMSRSTLVRDSGKTSDTVDSFFTLKLDIQTDSVHSVRDALVRLNATEDVHDVDGKVKGHRRMFFDELPPVLIMHLKLFRYSNGVGQKIQKNISFDVHLQIPKEMMSRFGKPKYHPLKSRSYKLFGVVNHHGTKMDDGHYTSDVFLPIVNGWLHFDDTKVSSTDETTVLKHVDKSMPYLLFYRRVDV